MPPPAKRHSLVTKWPFISIKHEISRKYPRRDEVGARSAVGLLPLATYLPLMNEFTVVVSRGQEKLRIAPLRKVPTYHSYDGVSIDQPQPYSATSREIVVSYELFYRPYGI